jgi:hypothetical protein
MAVDTNLQVNKAVHVAPSDHMVDLGSCTASPQGDGQPPPRHMTASKAAQVPLIEHRTRRLPTNHTQ